MHLVEKIHHFELFFINFLNRNIIPDIFISAFFHRLQTEYGVIILYALCILFFLQPVEFSKLWSERYKMYKAKTACRFL